MKKLIFIHWWLSELNEKVMTDVNMFRDFYDKTFCLLYVSVHNVFHGNVTNKTINFLFNKSEKGE